MKFNWFNIDAEQRSAWASFCPENEYRVVPSDKLPGPLPRALTGKFDSVFVAASGSPPGVVYWMLNGNRVEQPTRRNPSGAIDQQPFGADTLHRPHPRRQLLHTLLAEVLRRLQIHDLLAGPEQIRRPVLVWESVTGSSSELQLSIQRPSLLLPLHDEATGETAVRVTRSRLAVLQVLIHLQVRGALRPPVRGRLAHQVVVEKLAHPHRVVLPVLRLHYPVVLPLVLEHHHRLLQSPQRVVILDPLREAGFFPHLSRWLGGGRGTSRVGPCCLVLPVKPFGGAYRLKGGAGKGSACEAACQL